MNDREVRARLLQYLTRRGYRPVEEVVLASRKTRIDVVGMKDGVLCGFGAEGYELALDALHKILTAKKG